MVVMAINQTLEFVEFGRKLSVVAVCEESVKGEKWKGKRRVIGYRCEKRTAIRASGNEMK